MVKVYTKAGDKGTSSLYNGTKLPKNHYFFEALGSIDELSSHLGHLIVLLSGNNDFFVLCSPLKLVQTRLMDMGSSIATPDGRNFEKTRFQRHEREVEQWIDFLDTMLPRLTNFILPGGTEPAAVAHICRSVCRRAERQVLSVPNVEEAITIYLNRLSDFFFTLARYVNLVLNVPDVIYCASKPSEEKTEATLGVGLRMCPNTEGGECTASQIFLNDAAAGSER
jgi:cob(I)alamin adenosyltransferase